MNPFLEFFASNDALARLEAAVADAPATPNRQSLAALLSLAWQLRQRDTARALVLADLVDAGLAVVSLPDGERFAMAARLMLIRGEAQCLFGAFDTSAALAEAALRDFSACRDAIGCADAHWLRYSIAAGQGDLARRELELTAMAAQDGDPVRVTVAQAELAIGAAFRDVAAARQRWGALFAADSAAMHPAAAAVVESLKAFAAIFSGENVDAIRHFDASHTLALATGQIRRAIAVATNTGYAYNNLNDHHAALEWMQRGLDLARPCGWPSSMGSTLAETAETLRLLLRFDAARELLIEAMALLAPVATSYNYALALIYLGDVELNLHHYDDALACFQLLEQRAKVFDAPDLLCSALRGQARTLSQLNRPQEALTLAHAHATLAATKSNANWQIDALRVLADLHARHPLPPPPDMTAASPALHYLQQAQAVAATMSGFTIPGDLLEALAAEYANSGDTDHAYQLACQAIVAHEKIHSSEAANRASAMQVKHETQKAWAEGEQLRKLAAAHAGRADALEQANNTLEHLGAVGREITANLEVNAIVRALDTHVHALLDVTTFFIYQLEADGQTLRMTFGVEAGQPVPPHCLRLDDPQSNAARCAREHNVLIIAFPPDSVGTMPGTLDTQSAMFAPLLVSERLLGVMTVQSVHAQAYHARETAIFGTLSAYAAIALANTHSQAQMVQHEKMASLGQLVANVAHEINTPIGAVKSSGASIAEALDDMLGNMPRLFSMLDEDGQVLFQTIIGQAKGQNRPINSREERKLINETTQQLEQLGVVNARHHASVLVQLRAHADLGRYLPLLSHPDSGFILDTAGSVALVINGTANINAAVERVAKIVFALKAFSRIGSSGEMIETPLQSGLDTVLTIYHNQIKNSTTLVQNYEDIPPLRCLPDELNQVWTNLISNALHAMKYQGTLTLGIRQEGDEAVVTVGDSGGGIPESIKSRIFDPFFTTKPTGEGSGLGLDIAKKIIAKHKGRIEVQSEVGKGTTFSVYLPYS